jgi:hypothetical protein
MPVYIEAVLRCFGDYFIIYLYFKQSDVEYYFEISWQSCKTGPNALGQLRS